MHDLFVAFIFLGMILAPAIVAARTKGYDDSETL